MGCVLWVVGHRSVVVGLGSWFLGRGTLVVCLGSWVVCRGSRLLARGSLVLAPGFVLLGAAPAVVTRRCVRGCSCTVPVATLAMRDTTHCTIRVS